MTKSSQRGAARVNIVWLIVLLVGIIVAMAYGYISNDEAAKANEARLSALADATAKQELINESAQKVRDISLVLGAYDPEAASPQSDVTASSEALGAFRTSFDLDPSVNTFVKAAELAARDRDTLVREISQLKGEISTLRADVSAKEKAVRDLASEKDSRISDLESQLADAQQAAADRQSELEGQLADVRNSLRESDNSLRSERDSRAEDQRTFAKEEEALRSRLRDQGAKLAFLRAPEKSDGSVLAVSEDLAVGWIDLGTKNRLSRGTRFRVVDGLPGATAVKAWAQVTDVRGDMAEVSFFDVADAFDPVTAGDVIYNPVYDPEGERHAVLVGRFSGTYNERELRLLLGDMGITVQDSVNEVTDYLIVGSEMYLGEDGEPLEEPLQPTDTDVYKEAEANGVVIVPIKLMREYFVK